MKENINIENGFKNIQEILNTKKEITDTIPDEILFLCENLQTQLEMIKSNAVKLKESNIATYSLRVRQFNTHDVNDPENMQFDNLEIFYEGEWCHLDDRMIDTLTIEILEKQNEQRIIA